MDLNNSTTKEDEKDCAQTPWWFFHGFQQEVKLKFELDVCANKDTAKANLYYSLDEAGHNGLSIPWSGRNWCNPPYSDITPWVEKATLEASKGNITAMLIPDKAEVGYTKLAREHADTVYHMESRLKFIRPNGEVFKDKKTGREQGPKFPVCVFLFTPWGLKLPIRDSYINIKNWQDKG